METPIINGILQINISGGAYFQVLHPDMVTVYTFSRTFFIDDAGILKTYDNFTLTPQVNFSPPFNNPIAINDSGQISVFISGVWVVVGQIMAVLFATPSALIDLGNGYYGASDSSGPPNIGVPGSGGLFENVKISFTNLNPAGSRRSIAVLKVKVDDYKGILDRAKGVSSAMNKNSAIYTNPNPLLGAIDAQVLVVQGFIDKVNTGDHSFIASRNEAAVTLYNMLKNELIYVNKRGNYDRAILILSGFPVNKFPEPQPIPDKVVIKRVEDGKEPNTAKFFIMQIGQRYVFYNIQTTLTPDDETSWKTLVTVKSSMKLIVPGLENQVLMWYRIAAGNAHGMGQWSNRISFISQN